MREVLCFWDARSDLTSQFDLCIGFSLDLPKVVDLF